MSRVERGNGYKHGDCAGQRAMSLRFVFVGSVVFGNLAYCTHISLGTQHGDGSVLGFCFCMAAYR